MNLVLQTLLNVGGLVFNPKDVRHFYFTKLEFGLFRQAYRFGRDVKIGAEALATSPATFFSSFWPLLGYGIGTYVIY